MELTVVAMDGEELRLRVRPGDTISHCRRRLQALAQQGPEPVLCCEGAVLADGVLVDSLPAHRRLASWLPRYTRHRSEAQVRERSLAARAAAFDRRAAAATVRRAAVLAANVARTTLKAARNVDVGVWLRLAVWLPLFWAVCRVDLGGPFLIVSAVALLWRVGFSERPGDAESAYTVFNRDFRALPGQLNQEDVQRAATGGLG
jgi:hypothetical protein